MRKVTLSSWSIVLFGALFFFYSFFQVNLMTSIGSELEKAFRTNAAELGLLAAWVFYANVIFLLPAGLLLDRMEIRKLSFITLGIAVGGTLLFSIAPNMWVVAIARFITGIMVAFGLILCLKLASLVLSVHQMALASSLIVSIGMIGGMVSQTPLTFLIELVGWRLALLFVALLGLLIAMVLWKVVPLSSKDGENFSPKGSPWKSLLSVIKRKENWGWGLFIALTNLPLAVFGALFGKSYLIHVHGLASIQAASILSMLFLGFIPGSPFFGWVTNRWRRPRLWMSMGALLCACFMASVLFIHPLGTLSLYVLFFLIGFTSGCQVLGYSMVTEGNPSKETGSALSLAAMVVMGVGYGVSLPLFGWLLERQKVFSLSLFDSYLQAFLALPIAIFVAVGIPLFLRSKEKHRKMEVSGV